MHFFNELGNSVAARVAATAASLPLVANIKYKYRKARLVKGKRWYVLYYAWDRQKKELVRKRHFGDMAKTKNLDERERKANKIVKEINKAFEEGKFKLKLPKKGDTVKPFAKDTLIESFDAVIKIKESTLKENSMGHYQAANKIFQTWFLKKHDPKFLLKDITSNILIEFADYLSSEHELPNSKNVGLAPRTRNNYIDTIQALLREINRRNKSLFEDNPAKIVLRLPVTVTKHAAYSLQQMTVIKNEILKDYDNQLMLFIYFIYYTLARPREIQRMRVRDIDINEQRIFIPAANAKNNRDEYVDIYPPLLDLIKKNKLMKFPQDHFLFTSQGHPGERQVHKDHYRRRHALILKKIGLYNHAKGYDLYGYKHTGAIALFEATKDPVIVKEQCRHRSLEQTMVYLRDLNVFRSKDHFHKIKGF